MGGGKSSSGPANIRAVAVGKIKEKLENVGLALLSLSLMSSNPMDTWGMCPAPNYTNITVISPSIAWTLPLT